MEAIKYTLFVGGGTIDRVEPILVRHDIKAATMTPVHGLWNSKLEYGTKVEIISHLAIGKSLAELIIELKEVLKQDSILMTVEPLQASLL